VWCERFTRVSKSILDCHRNIGNSTYWQTLGPYYQIINGVTTTMPKNGPQTIFRGRFRYQPSLTSGFFTQEDIQAVIRSFIEQKKILASPNGNITTCWWNCPHCPHDCGGASGFRSYFPYPANGNTLLKYSIVGDPTTSSPVNYGAIPFPFGVPTYPNNDPSSACMAMTYVHNLIEIITNPTGRYDAIM